MMFPDYQATNSDARPFCLMTDAAEHRLDTGVEQKHDNGSVQSLWLFVAPYSRTSAT